MLTIAEDPIRANDATEILKAVGHPIRLRLIACLCESQMHVSALAERLSVPPAIVSQQLRILRGRRLVEASRSDGRAYYRLSNPHLRQLVGCIDSCCGEGDE